MKGIHMKQLLMKARSGVTLVELLVVMLIVTILSVSLLPMFKEYITKAQYAAEAVPVIGTLRTKIGLYQYDHSKLPINADSSTDYVSTWNYDGKETFKVGKYSISTPPSGAIDNTTKGIDKNNTGLTDLTDTTKHIGDTTVLDIDFQDMKGKRTTPFNFVYYQIPCDDPLDSAYVVGCFGSGDGLAAGTGYAVCELNLVSKKKKYVGTFERYKAKDKTGSCPYLYLNNGTAAVSGDYVYCPSSIGTAEIGDASDGSERPNVVFDMETAGWKFSD